MPLVSPCSSCVSDAALEEELRSRPARFLDPSASAWAGEEGWGQRRRRALRFIFQITERRKSLLLEENTRSRRT